MTTVTIKSPTTVELKLTIDQLIEALRKLDPAEWQHVASEVNRSSSTEPKRYTWLDLEGLGQEFWQDIDVEAYINEERNAWDG